LRNIGELVDKSYHFFNEIDLNLDYFENIETNVEIKKLENKNVLNNYFLKTFEDKNIEIKFNNKSINSKKKVAYIKSNIDAEFFAFTYYDTLIFSFIGSDSITDMFYDLKINKEKIFLNGKFCTIHRGFYEQYYSIKNSVLEIFKQFKLNNNNPKVLIIGHSLGTIGQLCAFDIKNECENVNIDFITFGAPCCGDYNYVNLIDKIFINHIRLINNDDLVPIFLEFFGYKHSGNIILFRNEEVLYENNEKWVDLKNIVISIFFKFIPFFGSNIIISHTMNDYNKKIENFIKKILKIETNI
jgi:hypothetical protein